MDLLELSGTLVEQREQMTTFIEVMRNDEAVMTYVLMDRLRKAGNDVAVWEAMLDNVRRRVMDAPTTAALKSIVEQLNDYADLGARRAAQQQLAATRAGNHRPRGSRKK